MAKESEPRQKGKAETTQDVLGLKPSELQNAALIMVIGILMLVLIYVISHTLSWIALFIATLFTVGIILIRPNIIEHLKKNVAVMYYCVFFMITLLFSIDHCKGNRDLVALVVTSVFVGALGMYTFNKYIVYIAIFMNMYVFTRIIITFLYEESSCLGTDPAATDTSLISDGERVDLAGGMGDHH